MTRPARRRGRGPVRVAHIATSDLTHRFLLLGQLCRLRDEGYEVTAISAPGPWTVDLESRGIRWVPWRSATRAWDIAADLRAFRELLGILRRERFDLVHTHNPKPGVLGRIAARLAGVPWVVNTVHGFYATADDPASRRVPVLAIEWVASRFSDLELYQSEEDLAWARKRWVASPGSSLLLGNGTDLSRFDPTARSPARLAALREELGILEEAPVVGMVGRLVEEKGYRDLLQAMRIVRSSLPAAQLLVAGATDHEKADAIPERELAAEDGHVVFAGWRSDIPELLALMDVFVLPSRREGVPRSAIEAAAMGRPMVLTNIRGCREVVQDGREGLLVPPQDPARLGEAILRLLRDRPLAERMAGAARARAEERFDEHRVVCTLLEAYDSLLGGRAPVDERRSRVRIRSAIPSDAPDLARLHQLALPDAFLPTLGRGFLGQLYRALASDPRAVVLVAEEAAGVVGLAAGVTSVRDFYRSFAWRRGAVALAAAAPRLVRPRTLRRALETARYPTLARRLPEPELLSIAVDERWRGRGVGRRLADELLQKLGRKGVRTLKVAVGADNAAANGFYASLGFRHVATIAVHDGACSNVWVGRCP